ncbi:MAG: VWA domain-containing protein, partial [Luteitalea sp.]
MLIVLLVAMTMKVPIDAQAPAPRRADGVDTSGVTAVVVDLIVRDRRGQPVTDLTADDFEVYEDGMRQTVGSFRLPGRDHAGVYAGAARPSTTGTAAAPAPAAAPAAAEASVVALVFDRLAPDSRRLTQLAADRYLGKTAQTDNVLGVFAADWGLEVVQGFTRDAVALRAALAQVGSRAPSQTTASRGEARAQMD